MSVTINTNVDSIKIQNCLTSSTNNLSKAMQRMSTGLKINTAKDDAAGTVIAAKMGVQLDGNSICQNNVQSANALLSTAEGNLDVVQDNVTRIRDLALQAKNGTYSDNEISAMNDEVQERLAEINRVSESAKYSDSSLFEDTAGKGTNGATFQVGANAGDENTIKADKSIFASVKFSSLSNLQNFKLTKANATDATIEKLDTAINNITDRKSKIGSAQNRLESALSTLETQYTNLSSSKSIITDADIASEASNYTSANILQQISTSLLAQANQAPSVALSLV